MKRIRLLLWVGMCIAFGLVYLSPAWANPGGASLSPMASLEKGTAKTLKDLPLSAREAVSAALGQDDPSYHISGGSEGFQAGNAAQKLAIAFSQGTVQVRSGASLWKLRLKGLGYGQDLLLAPAKAVRKNNRLEYVRGSLTEWYINGPLGLEQGFTVLSRPSGQGNSPLTIGFSMEGDLKASVDGDKQGLWLCRQDGTKVLRYGGLRANDAAGKELAAWLEIKGSQLFLRVKEAGAVYPVVIDPFVQQAKLTASDGAAEDFFGYSVSLSSDGNTALFGVEFKTFWLKRWQGAAYVFTRSGTTWSQQQELLASDGAAEDRFGHSVSLSSDGNTALIGAYQKTINGNYAQGAAYVFVRSGTQWSQQAELTASDGAELNCFGGSVSLSGDGNTALIGGYDHTIGQGAAYVFVRSGTQWSQQAELTASDGADDGDFGFSVSLSGDGNTALIGADGKTIGKNQSQGAAYVFVRSGGTWSQQDELTANDGAANDCFGWSVSLSSDGNTALIGAPGEEAWSSFYQGWAYVFVRSGTIWSQQQELTTFDAASGDVFGNSVSLSGDGNTALIGAPWKTIGVNNSQGAAYVFTRSGTVWSQLTKLTASDGAVGDNFGGSVSLSSDDNTALIGAPGKTIGANISQGAAYVFEAVSAPSVTTSTATNVTQHAALLNGTVNANNASTTVTFQYGLTTGYGTTVTTDQSPVTGNSNTGVSKAISGLMANTTYHFRVKGVNIAGTTKGGDLTFTTQAVVPTVTTNAATYVIQNAAALNGTVNAHNASTKVTFQYGLTTAYGSTVTAHQSPVTGNSNTAVSKAISGLNPNTTYHYRVVGVNIAGTTFGLDQTFKTQAAVPTMTTNAATNVTQHSATLNGTVNAHNASTTVTFQYALRGTYYVFTVTADQSPVKGNSNTAVSKAITGLNANATYDYWVKGVNIAGTTYGKDLTFKTTGP